MIRTTRRALRTAVAAVLSAVLVATLAACSGGGSDDDDSGDTGGTSAGEAIPGVATEVTFGKVTGKLPQAHRAPLRKQVTKTFDAWVDSAYVAGKASDAFAVFTKDAAGLAKRDPLMSNAALADRVDSVTATSRKLWIDVLADHGRAVGVTGRFVVVIELDGQLQRTDRIAGRLLLRRGDHGWRIFGYNVKRGRVA
jgi:hypothetical protein